MNISLVCVWLCVSLLVIVHGRTLPHTPQTLQLATRVKLKMAHFGKIEEFTETSIESWTQYKERLDQYFIANDIDDDKRRAVLLSICGSKTYSLVRSLVSPTKPCDKSYAELCETLEKHFCPKPSKIVQRYKFNTCVRRKGDSVSTYIADLRKLSEHCEYGQILDEMIRDRIVCGIADDRIQRRLLSESDLTLKKAVEISLAIELAAKNIIDLHESGAVGGVDGPSSTTHVNKLVKHDKFKKPYHASHGQKKSFPKCFHCGSVHDHNFCKFKNAKCYVCSNRGHISSVCPSKESSGQNSRPFNKHFRPQPQNYQPQSQNYRQNQHQNQHQRHRNHNLTEGGNEQSYTEEAYTLYKLSSRTDPIRDTFVVDGVEINMEIDTGASLTVISEATHDKLFRNKTLCDAEETLLTYTGQPVDILGYFEACVEYKTQTYTLPIVVVKGNTPTLVDRNWLEYLKLDWHRLFKIYSPELKDLIAQYSDVFRPELGKFTDCELSLLVEDSVHPRFFKARPLPYALRERVDQELDRLIRLGVITPVKQSNWAAPVVPVVKSDNSIRLCGDYKITINQASKPDPYPIPRIDDLYATLGGGKTYTKLDMSNAYQQLVLDQPSRQYTTINTHRGLFQYSRLPFGVSASPGLFQRTMDKGIVIIFYVSHTNW